MFDAVATLPVSDLFQRAGSGLNEQRPNPAVRSQTNVSFQSGEQESRALNFNMSARCVARLLERRGWNNLSRAGPGTTHFGKFQTNNSRVVLAGQGFRHSWRREKATSQESLRSVHLSPIMSVRAGLMPC